MRKKGKWRLELRSLAPETSTPSLFYFCVVLEGAHLRLSAMHMKLGREGDRETT